MLSRALDASWTLAGGHDVRDTLGKSRCPQKLGLRESRERIEVEVWKESRALSDICKISTMIRDAHETLGERERS